MLLLTAYKRGAQRVIYHPRSLQLKRGILSTPSGNCRNFSPRTVSSSGWSRKKITTTKGKTFFIVKHSKEPRRRVAWGKRWKCEIEDGVVKESTCEFVAGDSNSIIGSGVGTQEDPGRSHESHADEEYDIDLITLRRVPRRKPTTELDPSQQESGSLHPAQHDQLGWHWNLTTELDTSQKEPGPLPSAQHDQLGQHLEFSSSGKSKPNTRDISGETPPMRDHHRFDQTEITDTVQEGKRYSQPSGSPSKPVSSTTEAEVKGGTLNAGTKALADPESDKEPRVISSNDGVPKSETDAKTGDTHHAPPESQRQAPGEMALPSLPQNPTYLEVDNFLRNLNTNLDALWKTQNIPSPQPTKAHIASCESTAMSDKPDSAQAPESAHPHPSALGDHAPTSVTTEKDGAMQSDPTKAPGGITPSTPGESYDHVSASTLKSDTMEIVEDTTLSDLVKLQAEITPLPYLFPAKPYSHHPTSTVRSDTAETAKKSMLGGSAEVSRESTPLPFSAVAEPCDNISTATINDTVQALKKPILNDATETTPLPSSTPLEPYDGASKNSAAESGTASVKKEAMLGGSTNVHGESAPLQSPTPARPYDHPLNSMATDGTVPVMERKPTVGDSAKATDENTTLQFPAPAEPYDRPSTPTVTGGTTSVVGEKSTIGDSKRINEDAPLQFSAPVGSCDHFPPSAVTGKTVSPTKNTKTAAPQVFSEENKQVCTVMESPVGETTFKSHRPNIGLEKTRGLPDMDIHSPVSSDIRKGKIPEFDIEGGGEKHRNIIAAESNAPEKKKGIFRALESPGAAKDKMNLKTTGTMGPDRDYEWLGTENVSAEDALKPMDPKVDPTKHIPSTTIMKQTVSEIKPSSTAKPPSPPIPPQNYYILVWNPESGSMHFTTLPSICQFSTNDDTAFDALRNLDSPEKFLPLWRVLQMEGFTVIGGEKNCLIVKVDVVGSKAKQLSVLKEIQSKFSPMEARERLGREIPGKHSIITSEAMAASKNVADRELFHESITEQISKKHTPEVKWVKPKKNRPFRSIFWAAVWVAACSGAVDIALGEYLDR